MKYIITFIASITIIATNANSAPEDFIGAFKSTEKTTLSGCLTYNGVSTSPWSVSSSDLSGTSFKGNGSNDNGQFSVAGEIAGQSATGTIKGTNKYGKYWEGTFESNLDGNKYTATTKGAAAVFSCKFESEIEATRNEVVLR